MDIRGLVRDVAAELAPLLDTRQLRLELQLGDDALLAKAGTDKTRILRAQIFLADIADFPGMNAVWDTWVVAGHTPPRATVQASLAKPEWKIEVVITAAVRA